MALEARIIAQGIWEVLIDNHWKFDAAEHFLWSFNTKQRVGVEASRVHLINYELAGLVNRTVIGFIDERYGEYLQQGQNGLQARRSAWVEGVAFALNCREILLEEAAEDFDAWNQHFSNSEVMDLWNDNVGQQTALHSGPLANSFLLFLSTWDDGSILVMSEDDADATMERRQYIFEHKHMWNPWVKP